jgi:hypothetical protein
VLSLSDNLLLLVKVIENHQEFVRKNLTTVAREFYKTAMATTDFLEIQPASMTFKSFLVDTKSVCVTGDTVITPTFLNFLI